MLKYKYLADEMVTRIHLIEKELRQFHQTWKADGRQRFQEDYRHYYAQTDFYKKQLRAAHLMLAVVRGKPITGAHGVESARSRTIVNLCQLLLVTPQYAAPNHAGDIQRLIERRLSPHRELCRRNAMVAKPAQVRTSNWVKVDDVWQKQRVELKIEVPVPG